MIESGVVGVNIEDSLGKGGGLRDVEEQCRRIACVRDLADRRGVPLVINARVDSFVSPSITDREHAMETAVMRAWRVRRGRGRLHLSHRPGDEPTVSPAPRADRVADQHPRVADRRATRRVA